jgi:hypothetical protein
VGRYGRGDRVGCARGDRGARQKRRVRVAHPTVFLRCGASFETLALLAPQDDTLACEFLFASAATCWSLVPRLSFATLGMTEGEIILRSASCRTRDMGIAEAARCRSACALRC